MSASSFLYRLMGCLDLARNAGQKKHKLSQTGIITCPGTIPITVSTLITSKNPQRCRSKTNRYLRWCDRRSNPTMEIIRNPRENWENWENGNGIVTNGAWGGGPAVGLNYPPGK